MTNIISLSGYIGSGKDSVGSIIQKLTTPKTYRCTEDEFGGTARDAKGDYILKPEYSPWRIKKFAGKLKQIASMMTGIPVEKFEDQEFKKTVLSKEWNTDYAIPFSGPDHTIVEEEMTVRTFLQKLGTEAIRDGLHTNAWVNALFADYKKSFNENSIQDIYDPRSKTGGMEYPKWIITDTRFPNEAQAIKDRGGIVIRVIRPEVCKDDESSMVPKHPSETALDDWSFDYIIDNCGSLDDLEYQTSIMLQHFNII